MTREITPEELLEFAENVFMVGPDFASDLAACFDGLEWFCEKNVLIWELGRAVHPRVYYCCFEADCRASSHTADCRDDVETEHLTYADTKQAAIIKAVNAAARARSKA